MVKASKCSCFSFWGLFKKKSSLRNTEAVHPQINAEPIQKEIKKLTIITNSKLEEIEVKI